MLIFFFNTQQSTATAVLSSSSAAYNPHRYQWLSSACGGAKAKECSPISKETMPQEDAIIVTATTECNKSRKYFEDGQSVVRFANGTRKETLMCGKVSHRTTIGTIHSLAV